MSAHMLLAVEAALHFSLLICIGVIAALFVPVLRLLQCKVTMIPECELQDQGLSRRL